MSSLYVATTGKVALAASTTESLLLLNPVTNKGAIFQVDVSMDASSLAEGVQFDLYRVTDLGEPAGTALTPLPLSPTDPEPTTTALSALTTEPADVEVLASWLVQPVGGLLPLQLPLGREVVLAGGGARVGLRYTTPASVTPDCIANVWFEE